MLVFKAFYNIEEVIKRLAENNLCIKPEKYKWKIRKIEFLGVMLGPEETKIEQERVKMILDWLNSKESRVFRSS